MDGTKEQNGTKKRQKKDATDSDMGITTENVYSEYPIALIILHAFDTFPDQSSPKQYHYTKNK